MDRLFFELIQVAIGNHSSLSIVPTATDWEYLYSRASQQTLLGVCFCGVQKLPKEQIVYLPLPLKMQWLATVAKIQRQNELINHRCIELQHTLSVSGFRTYIMKGQGNSALYYSDLCYLRQCGDIDIYLEGGYDKVMEYVNATFPTIEVNELEIHYHCFNDVDVEIHYKPFIFDGLKDKILQRFFKECAEANFANRITIPRINEQIIVPITEFNIVHQLVHILHHLFYEGIGLRQLMDYYFVLNDAYKRKTNVVKVKSVISSLGLDRFASALMWVLSEAFGLNKEWMIWAPNDKDGRFLLQEIMQSGNFGRLDERQKGIYQNKWKSFWLIQGKAFRFWRFDHCAWFWIPICRIKEFVWRKCHGYK